MSFRSVLLMIVGVAVLYVTVPNTTQVVRAATADGTPGVFTAARLRCVPHPGHVSCTWTGRFRSVDGSVELPDVALQGSDRDSLRAGARTAAVDVGDPRRVLTPGSRAWVRTALLLAAGVVMVLGSIALAHRDGARRPDHREETPLD